MLDKSRPDGDIRKTTSKVLQGTSPEDNSSIMENENEYD